MSNSAVIPNTVIVPAGSDTQIQFNDAGVSAGSSKFTVNKTTGATLINGQLDVNTHKIVNVTDPAAAQDAATKTYVDAAVKGWQFLALPVNFVGSAAFTTALSLPANGGSVAVLILVTSRMALTSVSVRNTDTGTQRTWGWDLYQDLNTSNTLSRVAASNADETFTPGGAASTRNIVVASSPVILQPGTYWLVIQNRHATNTFGVGTTAVSAAFAVGSSQTKTTTNPNGATLDFVAAVWTKTSAMVATALAGQAFANGQF